MSNPGRLDLSSAAYNTDLPNLKSASNLPARGLNIVGIRGNSVQ
jgi:hypothetical protein